MSRALKPYTFGMELEVDIRKRGRNREMFSHIPWIRSSHAETHRIYEFHALPSDGREFLRRSCILGHLLGFQHGVGSNDPKAESFHLHMGHRARPNTDWYNTGGRMLRSNDQLSAHMLVAAHHMSRTGVEFRTRWTNINRFAAYQGYRDQMSVLYLRNNDIGTLEMRLNENPAPLVLTMLYPTIVDERFRIRQRLELDSREVGAPLRMANTVREAMGGQMFDQMLSAAKQYWKFPLVNQVLDMFAEGATGQDVWAFSDNWFKQNQPKTYGAMLTQARI